MIPFYIFSHEKDFKVYNSNEERLAELKAEYQDILKRFDQLEQEGIIGALIDTEARRILNRGEG